MSKKKRRPSPDGNAVKAPKPAAGSKYAGYVWALALLLVFCGYFLLHKADPGGRNGWAVASPAFLLAGYLLFIPAISLTFRD
jgi:hypothetical protein